MPAHAQKMTPTRRRLASLATAAEHLGVCTRTVRRLISNGELTGYRIGPRAIRVDLNEVDELARPIPAAG
jgi:excisionase family DNA binding protein